MSEMARKLRAEYMKKWRKAHPEKAAEYTAKYWNNRAARLTEEERAELAAAELEAMQEAGLPDFDLDFDFDIDKDFDFYGG